MGEVFAYLGNAVHGAPLAALAAAFTWGVLSVLLSPCHLAGIPLVVGYIGDRGVRRTREAFLISLLFALGILATIAALGALTAAAGRMLGNVGPWGYYLGAVLFFVFGLYLLDVISLPWFSGGGVRAQGRGLGAALLMGLLFGAALGPCTFAYMAPILGVTFRLSADTPLYGASLLGAFGIGHCAVIAAAGTSAGAVQRYLSWGEKSRGPALMRKICGVLLLLGGLYIIYLAP
jgi:cytochrome c-type biogenesis protein